VLGPLEVATDDGRLVSVGGQLPRAILVALALAEGRPVPAGQLLAQVWPEELPEGRNRLQVHISRLRKLLGGDRIVTEAGSYRLQLPPGALDAARFSRLAAEGHTALQGQDPASAARLFREALGLWRGRPLEGFLDTGFAAGVIARLDESRLTATEDRIDADLRLGGHAELAGELEALVREHPLRERMWGYLILALYRAGRQGDALAAYQRARGILGDQLGVEPGPALRKLEEAVLRQDPALDAPAGRALDGPGPPARGAGRDAGNLPAAPSALIGRAVDLDAVASLMRDSRLVTITGAGGVGKTRLAVEAARGLCGQYRDGAWLAELASAGDAASVPGVLAAALGVTGMSTAERLGEFLSGRQALLVLDNCEHVIAGVARLAGDLLARCPDLRILATSRESLTIAGESLWPLQPLGAAAAAELFMARARAIAPGFPADEPAMAAITEICARLDGLPLAIELAAARTRAFAPADILARLADRFRLLTGGSRNALPRQQTLSAAVGWSYRLLFDEERRVFERMSAFAGPCTLQAAVHVCAGPDVDAGDIPDLLARLADKSLIEAVRSGDGVRFRLLQTLAEYGRGRLAERGEADAIAGRHARWAASVADVADGGHEPGWFAAFRVHAADIRRAMESALAAGDARTSLGIARGAAWFWAMGGTIGWDECWRWLAASLALPGAAHAEEAGQRVRVLAQAELLALAVGRDDALAYGEEAVSLGRQAADRQALAGALLLHGSALAGVYAERELATRLLDEAGTLLEAEGGEWSVGMAQLARGVAALARPDPGQAAPLLRSAADRFTRAGSLVGQRAALRHLADLAVLRGQPDGAISALEEMLAVLPAEAHPAAVIRMAELGCLYAFTGQPDQSAALGARAEAIAGDQRNQPLLAFASNARGLALYRLGCLAEAEEQYRRALRLGRDSGIQEGLAMAHASLGFLAEARGDAGAAERHHQASLAAALEVADRHARALALEGLAGAAALRGDAAASGRLLGAAAALREGAVGTVMGQGTAVRETIVARLAAAGHNAFGRAAARVGGDRAFGTGYAEGLRDPLAVLGSSRKAA